MPELPGGTVTFLFTDVEGSTRLWEHHPEDAMQMLARHDELFESIVEETSGVVVRPRGEGDSRFAVFPRARDAVDAAALVQIAIEGEPWPQPMRVRMALHTGEAETRDGDYYGAAVNRCARIRALAHGGQVIVSNTTHDLVRDAMPDGITLRDLGSFRLRDLTRVERLFQLCHPDLPDGFPALESIDRHPNNLPLVLTNLVGRDDEVGEVRALIAGERLVTLTGAAGCGKTRLALHVAAAELEASPAGVWFADLAPLRDGALVLDAVAAACGVQEERGRSLEDCVVDILASAPALVVLDNCEHLLDAAGDVATRLLSACPALRILATSREPVGVAGERAWRVPSLEVPAPDTTAEPDALSRYAAVRLFVYRARAALPGYALSRDDAAAVAEICRRLDGIPLAIELAAARIDVLSPHQIAERLDDRFRLLTGGSRTALERQQTLRAAVDWSHALLDPAARVLFRRLGVFVGGFSLVAAEEVCAGEGLERDEILDVLTQLVKKSLVQTERAGRDARYRLLETMRQLAREKLADTDESAVIRDRHALWCVAHARRLAEGMRTAGKIGALNAMRAERDNMRAALDWVASSDREASSFVSLAGSLIEMWNADARWEEGREWLERALATGAGSPEDRLTASIGRGHMLWLLADPSAASILDGAIAEAERLGNERLLCRALLVRGNVAYELEGEAFRPRWERAREIAERTGDRAALIPLMNAFALIEPDRATRVQLWEKGAALARELDDAQALGMIFVNLGTEYVWQGNRVRVREAFAQAEEQLTRAGDVRLLAFFRTVTAGDALRVGDDEVARRAAEETLRRPLAGRRGESIRLAAAATIAQLDGDYARAAETFGRVVEIAVEALSLVEAYFVSLSHAKALTLAGDRHGARAALDRAADLARGERFASWLDEAHAIIASLRGQVEFEDGEHDRATSLFRDALAVAGPHRMWLALFVIFLHTAYIDVARGSFERAARLLGAAEGISQRYGPRVVAAERPAHEAARAAVREAMGEEFDRAFDAGVEMSTDDAVALALSEASLP